MAAVDAFKVRAVIEAGYDKNSLRRANNEIATSFNSLRTRMSRVASAARASQTIFMTTGAGIVAAFGAGAMAAASFEEQFVRVKKTLDIKGETAQIEKSFDNIGKKLRDLTKQSPVTTDAITEIAAVGGQLGVAASDIVAFTNTIQKLTVATNLSAENASMAMSRLQEITGSSVDELDNLGSSLVALGNNFAAQESEIVNAAMQIATSTAQIKGEMNDAAVDALAFATALRAIGQPSQAGATAIVRLMSELSEAMAQGGDNLQLFAKVARMSVPAFEQLYSLDSSQAVASFIKGLDDTSSVGLTNISVLQKLGLGQVRTQKAILALAKANDTLFSALETANQAYRENNALTEEAERRYETLFSELAKGKNILKAEFIDFGLDKLDGAKKIVKDLNNILFITTRTALNLADGFTRTIIPVMGIVAAFKSVRASVSAAATDMRMFAELSNRATIAGATMATKYNTGKKGAGRFSASNVLSYSTGEDGTQVDPMLARAMVPRSFISNRLGLPFNTLGPQGMKERLSSLGIGKRFSMRALDTLAQPQLVEQIFGGNVPASLLMSSDKMMDAQMTQKGRDQMAKLRKQYMAGEMKKAAFQEKQNAILTQNMAKKGIEKRMLDASYSQDYFTRFSRETAFGGVKTYMPTAMGQAQARGSLLRAQMRTLPREGAIKAMQMGVKGLDKMQGAQLLDKSINKVKVFGKQITSLGQKSMMMGKNLKIGLTDNLQKASSKFKEFTKGYSFIFRGLKDFTKMFLGGFVDGIKDIGIAFKNKFGKQVTDIMSRLKTRVKNVMSSINTGISKASESAKKFGDRFTSVMPKVNEQAKSFITRINSGLSKASALVKNLGNQFKSTFLNFASSLSATFKMIFNGLRDFAQLWINGFKDGIQGIGRFFRNNFGFIFRGLRDFGKLWIDGLKDGIQGIGTFFKNNFGFVFRGLKQFAQLWINGFKDSISALATFFKNNFGFVFRGLRDFAKLWIGGFKDGITALLAPINNLLRRMGTGLASVVQKAKTSSMFDFKGLAKYNNSLNKTVSLLKKVQATQLATLVKGRVGEGDEAIPTLMHRIRGRASSAMGRLRGLRPEVTFEQGVKRGGFTGAAIDKINSGIKKLESMQVKSQARINQRQKMYDDLAIFRQDMKNKGALTYKQIIDNQIKSLLKRNQAETGIDPASLTKRQMRKFRGAALGGRMGAFEDHISELRKRAETTKDLTAEELQLLDATEKARAGMGRFTSALKGMALAAGKLIFQLLAFQALFAFVAKMGAKARGVEEFGVALGSVSEKLREIQMETVKLNQLTAEGGVLEGITDAATLEAAMKKVDDIKNQLDKSKRDAATEIGTSFVNDIIIAGTGNQGAVLESLIRFEMQAFDKSKDQVTKEIGSAVGNVLINAIDPEVLRANSNKLPSVEDVINSVLFSGKELGKDVNIPSNIFDGVSSSILIGLQDSIGKSVSGQDLIRMLGVDDITDPTVMGELVQDFNAWGRKFGANADIIGMIMGDSDDIAAYGPLKQLNKIFDNVKAEIEDAGLVYEDSEIAKFTLDLVQAMSTAEGVIGMSLGGIRDNFNATLNENSQIGKQVKEFMKNRLQDFRDTGLVSEAEIKRAGNNYTAISNLYLKSYDRFAQASKLTSDKLQAELGITESAALQLAARLDQAFKETRKSLVNLASPLPDDAFEDMTALDVLMETIKKNAAQTKFEKVTTMLGDLGKPVLAAELGKMGPGALDMAEQFLNNPALAAAQEIYLRSLGGADYVSEIVPDEAEGADAKRLEEMGYVLGERSVDGILQGLDDKADEVSEAFSSILMKAFDGAVKLFIIRSPSQLMRLRIGQPMIDGVIVGIEDGELKLKDTFNNILKRATADAEIPDIKGIYKGTTVDYAGLQNIVASKSEFAPNKFLAGGLLKALGTEFAMSLDMFAEKLSKSYGTAVSRMQEAFQIITDVTRAERAQVSQARNLVTAKQQYAATLRREATLTERLEKAKENLIKLEVEGMQGNITAKERIGVLQRELDLTERKRRLDKEFTAREALDIQAQEKKVAELGRMFNLGIVSALEVEAEQDALREMKGEFKSDTEKELFLLEYAEAIDAKEEYEKQILETSPELLQARETYIGLLDEQKLIQLDIQDGANSIAEAEEAVAAGVLAVEQAYAVFKEKAPEYQAEIEALDGAFGAVNTRVGELIETITHLSADGTFDFSGLKTQISDTVQDLSELLFAKELDEMMDMGGLNNFSQMYMNAVQAAVGGTTNEGKTFGQLMDAGLLGVSENPIFMDLYKSLGGRRGKEITDLSNITKFSEYFTDAANTRKYMQMSGDALATTGYAGAFTRLVNSMGVGTFTDSEGALNFSITNAEAISKGLSKELMAMGLTGMQDQAYKQALNLFLEGERASRSGPIVDEFFNEDDKDGSGFGTQGTGKTNININVDSNNAGFNFSNWLNDKLANAAGSFTGFGYVPGGMMGLRTKGFKMGGRVPDMTHIKPKKYAMGGRDNLMRRALVGEYGPEEVRFVPGSGFLVKPLTHGGRGNNTVVENLSVNVTGVPADPSQARKAAIEIRKALSRLDREGSTGGSVRRN